MTKSRRLRGRVLRRICGACAAQIPITLSPLVISPRLGGKMLKKLVKKIAMGPDRGGSSRRKFLTGAAAATGAALTAFPKFAAAQEKKGEAKAPAAPAVVSSTGPQSMRWQSTWP